MFNQKKIKCLSLDIWDTILRRKVHPDTIKMLTARQMLFLLGPTIKKEFKEVSLLFKERQKKEYEIGREELAKGNDDEYEISKVLQRCISHVSNNLNATQIQGILKQLIKYEINTEIDLCYPDKKLVKLISHYRFDKLVIISDFYMNEKKVHRILSSLSLPFLPDQFFISCDWKKNKRSGQLFKIVTKVLNLDPQEILHIGDNFVSDYHMAKTCGLQAKHFSPLSERYRLLKQQDSFHSRYVIAKANRLNFTKQLSNISANGNCISTRQKHLFKEGVQLAPFFLGFALFIDQQSRKNNHNQVFFCTREGIFFKKIFDLVQQQHPMGLNPIDSRILPVSRIATFMPSLKKITCDELKRLWTMYPDQSLRMLFRSLSLKEEEYPSIPKYLQLSIDKVVLNIKDDKRIHNLFDNQEFISQLTQLRDGRLSLLKQYFKSIDFPVNEKSLMVDVGWRGTIQDNICHIFPESRINGIYLGLQKFFNQQPLNCIKTAFIADDNTLKSNHPLLKHVIPIEMICSATGGSAIGYSQKQKVIWEQDTVGDKFHQKGIQLFQDGVILGAKRLNQYLKQEPIGLDELRHFCIQLVENFILDPPEQCGRFFLELKHDDSFGMGRSFHPNSNNVKLRDKIVGFLNSEKKRYFLKTLEESGWPQAILKTKFGGILFKAQQIKNKFNHR